MMMIVDVVGKEGSFIIFLKLFYYIFWSIESQNDENLYKIIEAFTNQIYIKIK